MKKIFLLILIVISAFLVTGCERTPGKNKKEFEIVDVEHALDFKVLYNHHKLFISVAPNTEVFYIDQIKIKNAQMEAYEIGSYEPIESRSVRLVDAETIFNINFYTENQSSYYEVTVVTNGHFPVLPEYKDQVILGDWQVIYDLNENFIGGTIIHMHEGIEYNAEVIPIRKEMISGFDTKTPGVKNITIKYLDITLETTITVVENKDVIIPDTGIVEIVETKLDINKVSELVASFIAVTESKATSGEDYDIFYRNAIHDTKVNEMYLNAFQTVGITSEQISFLTNLVKNEFGIAYKKEFLGYEGTGVMEHYRKLFTKDLVKVYNQVINNLKDYQLFMFVPIFFDTDVKLENFNLAQISIRGIRHTFTEIMNNLQNISEATINAFSKQYDLGYKKTTYLGLIKDKKVRYTAKCFTDVLTKLLSATPEDIAGAFDLMKVTYDIIVDYDFDSEFIKKTIKNAAKSFENLLSLVSKDDFTNCIKLLLKFKINFNIEDYFYTSAISDNIGALYDTVKMALRIINKIPNDLIDTLINYITNVINKTKDQDESELKAIMIFSKYFIPEYNKTDQMYKNCLIDFLTEENKFVGFNASFFEMLINFLTKLSKLDYKTITIEEMKPLIVEMKTLEDMQAGSIDHTVELEHEFILPEGANITDLFKYLTEKTYIVEKFEHFTIDNILFATFEDGINHAVLADQYTTMFLDYFIVDANDKDRYVIVTDNDVFTTFSHLVFYLNGTDPLIDIFDKKEPNDKEPFCEHLMSFQILDTKTNTLIPVLYKVDLKDVMKAEGFSTATRGLHTVLITAHNDILGDFLLPVDYVVIDEERIVTNVYMNLVSNKFIKGQDVTELIMAEEEYNYGYTVINNNGNIQITPNSGNRIVIIPMEDIKGFDINKEGIQTVYTEYLGKLYTFELTVFNREDAFKVKDIHVHYESRDNYFTARRYSEEYVKVNVETEMNSMYYSLKEFRKLFGDEYEITLTSSEEFVVGDNTLIFEITKNGKHYKTDDYSFYLTQKEYDRHINNVTYNGGEIYIVNENDFHEVERTVQNIVVTDKDGEHTVNGEQFCYEFKGNIELNKENRIILIELGIYKIEIPYKLEKDRVHTYEGLSIYVDGPRLKFDHHPDISEILPLIYDVYYLDDGEGQRFFTENEIRKLFNGFFTVEYLKDKNCVRVDLKGQCHYDIIYQYIENRYDLVVEHQTLVFGKAPKAEEFDRLLKDIRIRDNVKDEDIYIGGIESFIKEGGEYSTNELDLKIILTIKKYNCSLEIPYKIDESLNICTTNVFLIVDENWKPFTEFIFFKDPTIREVCSEISSIEVKYGRDEFLFYGNDLEKHINDNTFTVTIDKTNKTVSIKYNLIEEAETVILNYKLVSVDYSKVKYGKFEWTTNDNTLYFVVFKPIEMKDLAKYVKKIDFTYSSINGTITDKDEIAKVFNQYAKEVRKTNDSITIELFNCRRYVDYFLIDNNDILKYEIHLENYIPEDCFYGLTDENIISLLFRGLTITRKNKEEQYVSRDYFQELKQYLVIKKDERGNYEMLFDPNYIDSNKVTGYNVADVLKGDNISNVHFEVSFNNKCMSYNNFDFEVLKSQIEEFYVLYDDNGQQYKHTLIKDLSCVNIKIKDPHHGKTEVAIEYCGIKTKAEIYLYDEGQEKLVAQVMGSSKIRGYDALPTTKELVDLLSDFKLKYADGTIETPYYFTYDGIYDYLNSINVNMASKILYNDNFGYLVYELIFTTDIGITTIEVEVVEFSKLTEWEVYNYKELNQINILTTDVNFRITKDNFISNLGNDFNINVELRYNQFNTNYTICFNYNVNAFNILNIFKNTRIYVVSDKTLDANIVNTKVSFVSDNRGDHCMSIVFNITCTNGDFKTVTETGSFVFNTNENGEIVYPRFPLNIFDRITGAKEIRYVDCFGNEIILKDNQVLDFIKLGLIQINKLYDVDKLTFILGYHNTIQETKSYVFNK